MSCSAEEKRVENWRGSRPLFWLEKINWDATLKWLVSNSADRLLPMLGRKAGVKRWLNVEVPKIQHLRVDLLGETTSGGLLHIELQSTNGRGMASRMLEYAVAIHRAEGQYPTQVVIYAGNEPLRMKNVLRGPGFEYRFEMVDLRGVDGTPLLAMKDLAANMMALLTAVENKEAVIRRVVELIGELPENHAATGVMYLLLTCRMRALVGVAKREIERHMPSMEIDIRTDRFLGPYYRRGFAAGKAEGLAEGKAEGKDEGTREIVRRQLTRKFGALPKWVNERLATCPVKRLDAVAERLVVCTSLDQLFRRPKAKA